MSAWTAIQYVGTGLSLVAFAIAAGLFAYRARLKQRADIIKSAPESERLEAIATTAEIFRVDVSSLSRAQQQGVVLAQIKIRARRELLVAGLTLVVATLLAAIAIVAILRGYAAVDPIQASPNPFPISPADKQLLLNVERDLNNIDKLEEFPRSLRFIQYDCAQAALDAHLGMAEFMRYQHNTYQVFIKGLAFRIRLIPYVGRILNAQRKGYNLVVLRARTRQVAEKFALLATEGDFEKNYLAAMSEVNRQEQLFEDELVGSDPLPEELHRRIKDPDPDYCWPSPHELEAAYQDESNAASVRIVVENRPRIVHGFAASLFHFEGDVEAAIAMLTSAFQIAPTTEDINQINGLANALYLGGRDLREVLPAQERELQIVESRIRQIEEAKVWSQDEVKADPTGHREADNKIHDDLAKRYNRARFLVRLWLTYTWAQHGLGSQEDVLPQRDLHWSSAQKYASDAYESLRDESKSPPRFECTDHALDLRIKDTYAFVKLTFQAYLKTQRIPPDEFQVRQARSVLEDALAEAREEHRRLEEAAPSMARGRAAPSCFTEVETRAWVKRISSHLKLAEALRP